MKFYILFFIFPDCTEIGDGWLKFILISANHMYFVNREYFFIIPMYYEKTNVCNNQNSLERATIELKKVNISLRYIYNQIPTFFSFSENTVGQIKSHLFILFCVIFPFCQMLSHLYKRFLPIRHSSQTAYIFFYLPAIASILANWETASLYQSALN